MQLHRAQISILYKLRHTRSARFSQLMSITEMESDVFKFHIRSLVKLGYIMKIDDGSYTLTSQGKEVANNLDEEKRTFQKQPKMSVMMVLSRNNTGKGKQYLFQKKLRQPFYGYWQLLTGAVHWGEDFEDTANRELKKQTGLNAKWNIRSMYRKRDYQAGNKQLLEDKLFVIIEALAVNGNFNEKFHAGRNEWLTIEDYEKKPKHFTGSIDVIKSLQSGHVYRKTDAEYDVEEY